MKEQTMKKILMLRSNPFPGEERVYKEAKSLTEKGYDVTVLCWDRDLKFPPKEDFKGIKVERIHLKAGYGSLKELLIKMPLFWIKLFLRGLKLDFDVVHSYDYDTLPAGVWLKWIKGKKLIYDALELFCSYTSNKTVNRGMFFIERINLHFIDALIYTNEERLKIFNKKTGICHRLKEYIVVMHNYPEPGLKKGFGIANGESSRIIFQYNGVVNRDRPILNLLKAFKEVKSEKILFIIIGNHNTAYGDVLKRYVNENEMGDIVQFQDFTPIDKLLELMRKSHVGFVPLLKDSLNNMIPEPSKLYNNFATRNLAVVEDTPYLKKVVSDKGLGITCDFSNVNNIKKLVEWIIQNPEKVNNITEKAYQEYLSHYNWKKEGKKLISLYERMME